MFEVKTTGKEAVAEMKRFIEADLAAMSVDDFTDWGIIFFQNCEVAIYMGYAIDAIEMIYEMTHQIEAHRQKQQGDETE